MLPGFNQVERRGAAGGALAVMLLAGAAAAQPVGTAPRVALVVGNSEYAALPAIPACAGSAHSVAEQLRQTGFEVAERSNLSNGAMGAALDSLAKRLAGAGPAYAVLYLCGYTAVFDGRAFLLPVSASIDRASDVLTQGIATKSVLDLVGRSAGSSLVVLDAYAGPGASAGTMAASLAGLAPPPGHFLAVATETDLGPAPTPLVQALLPVLRAQGEPASAVVALQAALAASGAPAFVAVGTAATAPQAQASPGSGAAAQTPEAAAPAAPADFPTEDRYTEQDRRRVQAALLQLGYYAGAADGVIGPETRAAIRRYQHEIVAAMTGILSPAQAQRLLAATIAGRPP